jgi:hypothetical protein
MDPYRYEPDVPQKSTMDQATEMGQQALDQVSEAATVARDTVKENPDHHAGSGGRSCVRHRRPMEAAAVEQGKPRGYPDGTSFWSAATVSQAVAGLVGSPLADLSSISQQHAGYPVGLLGIESEGERTLVLAQQIPEGLSLLGIDA